MYRERSTVCVAGSPGPLLPHKGFARRTQQRSSATTPIPRDSSIPMDNAACSCRVAHKAMAPRNWADLMLAQHIR